MFNTDHHNPFPPNVCEMWEMDHGTFPPIAAVNSSDPMWSNVPNVQYEGEFTTILPVGEFASHVSYCPTCERDSKLMKLLAEYYSIQADISAGNEMLRRPSTLSPFNQSAIKALIVDDEKRADDVYRQIIDRSNAIHNS